MNKLILKVVKGEGVWNYYDAQKQKILLEAMAKYGVMHVKVHACGHAK